MDTKTPSITMLAIGIMILVASLFADSLGIGGGSGFGLDQAVGSIVGAVVAAVGLFFTLKAE